MYFMDLIRGIIIFIINRILFFLHIHTRSIGIVISNKTKKIFEIEPK